MQSKRAPRPAKSYLIERRYTAEYFLHDVDARTLAPVQAPWEPPVDTYTGEDDLTEYYIELRNDEYAQRQTAIDAAYGM